MQAQMSATAARGRSQEMIVYTEMTTPIGNLLLAGDENGLREIRFEKDRKGQKPERDWKRDPAALAEERTQLEEYFAGKRTQFDLRLAPEGTPFQRCVWKALAEIPYGETISYGELARRIDKPTAARAVGAANGKNPLPIVLPCHRVIGSSGKLVGFGGGLDVKEALLDVERRVTGGQRRLFRAGERRHA